MLNLTPSLISLPGAIPARTRDSLSRTTFSLLLLLLVLFPYNNPRNLFLLSFDFYNTYNGGSFFYPDPCVREKQKTNV